MNNLVKTGIAFTIIFFLGLIIYSISLGQKVEVPPASVGKILTKEGYQEGTKKPSKFRLERCWAYCERLVILEASDFKKDESFNLFMPKDRLKMKFDVRLTMAVNPESYEKIFNNISPIPDQKTDRVSRIPLIRVYDTYASPIVQSEIREFMSNYSIMEVANNRDKIGQKLSAHLVEKMEKKDTPFTISYAGLSEVNYPDVIVQAQENAAKRREDIKKEEAELEVSKVSLNRKLQEEQLQRKVDVEKARAEAEVNEILGKSITPKYIKYRQLEALDLIAQSDNTKFVPFEMLSSMGSQVMIGNQATK